jgi:ComF family protein
VSEPAGLAALVRAARERARELEEFALPQRCPGCGAPAPAARLLCDGCWERVPALSFPVCARCLARGAEPVGCRRHPGSRVWPALVYDERAALLVHALKFGQRPGLAAELGARLARAVPATPAFDLVTAVPLHAARRRERGYDQARLLAETVADRLGVPALPDALVRERATPAQTGLDPAQRRRNLAGAFRVTEPRRLRGRRILIVDDVITTGATLEACLAALSAAGAAATGAVLAWAQ